MCYVKTLMKKADKSAFSFYNYVKLKMFFSMAINGYFWYNGCGGYDMDREKISDSYKWDLTKIYGSIQAYKEDINVVKDNIGKFIKYKDIIYDENSLYEVINLVMDTSRILEKLEVYTSLLCDEDTRINKNQELKEEVNNLYSEYVKATYFVDVDILKLDYQKIEEFYKKNNKLREYEIYLKEMFRYKKHTLSSKEEKVLADLTKALGNNYDTYELLKDSDLEFPNFIVNGKEYPLDGSKYSLYIEDDDREIRKGAFLDLYRVYKQYKNVFANLISANVKEEEALAKIRKYDGAIEASMYHDELDISIHDNLVRVVRDRLDVLHRYYELKKRVLKLDELHLYDVYANLVKNDSYKYPFDKAREIVIKALSVLGNEYIDTLKQGISDRWIDVYPNKGKRTGGYSSGAYDTSPYILLNYQDKYDDMSTLAHELGHSMHSYYTRHNNPYQYGHYAIFVAEVASTVNELLLAKYVINSSNDKNEKLFIINRMMELFRATIFRQTMFSEFERKIYHKISNDEPLTADILSDIYYNLNKDYFGNNVIIDDEIRYEWERIPHFYYNFYVYKYATGLSAAASIVTRLLDGTLKPDDYLAFLKCGKSKSPLDSLKLAGVDLSDKKVIEDAVKMFESLIDDFEKTYF